MGAGIVPGGSRSVWCGLGVVPGLGIGSGVESSLGSGVEI